MKKKWASRVKNDGRGTILGEADLKCLKFKNFVF